MVAIMKTAHRKKKIEIVLEGSILERALECLEQSGATGYTVVPAIAGRGHGGAWRTGEISGALGKIMIIVIVDSARAEETVDMLWSTLRPYSAILYASDVEVIRDEHF
jgi:nitrogen regulatory protein PII